MEKYMSKTVLVTGAAGYIGRHVVKALLDLGAKVVAVDIRTENIDPRADRKNIDIFSGAPDLYNELGEPDACLHLAWQDGFAHNADSHIMLLPAHFTFLKNLLNAGLKQLAVMGSMHEVGYYEGEIREDTPTNPRSMYGIAKNALRDIMTLETAKHGAALQWIRGFYIYGDDRSNHSVFTKIIEAESKKQKTFPFNSGINQYDFIPVEELARQLALTVMQTEVTGIINCCSGKPVALKDKVEEFLRKNQYEITLDYGKFPDRAYDSPAIWGSTDKIDTIVRNYESSRKG
jgi:dTDP-6-deoxy-L-talose 4-dehydrogenase (NAD+)